MPFAPALRRSILVVHIAASVGWLGAVLAYIPLDVATAVSTDESTVRSAYVAMHVVAKWALVPLALAAFVTGVVVSLGTPWGLFRHWWVVLSLALTALAVVVLVVEVRVVAALAAAAADPTTTLDELRALPSTLPHSIGGALVLVFVTALNVVKPRGLTRYGWRKAKHEAKDAGRG